MLSKENQTGRSMIEMLGVLGIMAVITVLGISAYTMATKNVKVNSVRAEINSIVQQVKSNSPQNDYSAWGNTKTFENSFVRTGLMKTYNAFGKTGGSGFGYEVSSVNGGSEFQISVLGLSVEECNLLNAQDWTGSELFSCN